MPEDAVLCSMKLAVAHEGERGVRAEEPEEAIALAEYFCHLRAEAPHFLKRRCREPKRCNDGGKCDTANGRLYRLPRLPSPRKAYAADSHECGGEKNTD